MSHIFLSVRYPPPHTHKGGDIFDIFTLSTVDPFGRVVVGTR